MEERHFKDLSELTLMDDYMFGVVMQDPALAKAVIECILDVKLRRVQYVEPQKQMKERYEARAIRLDLYVEDENGSVYNVEVQTTDKRNLPRRMRYYQSNIDLHILSPGVDYRELRKSYVIFICGYDPFGLNRCVYTFENRCLEAPELPFGDDTTKVVVNIRGIQQGLSGQLLEMIRYLNGGEVTGEITRALDSAVNDVKNSEERRREYMVMRLHEMEIREEGREEGLRQGVEQGMQQGMQQGIRQGMQQGIRQGMQQGIQKGADLFGALVTRLISLNRLPDVERAAADAEYRAALYREFGLA